MKMKNVIIFGECHTSQELKEDVQIIVSEKEVDGETIPEYGISILATADGKLHSYASIPGISTKHELIRRLADLLSEGHVYPNVAYDVIEEFIAYNV